MADRVGVGGNADEYRRIIGGMGGTAEYAGLIAEVGGIIGGNVTGSGAVVAEGRRDKRWNRGICTI